MRRRIVILVLISTLTTFFVWTSYRIMSGSEQTLYFKFHNNELQWSARKEKLLCWILTVDNLNHREKSKAVLDTWGARCDRLIFVRNGSRLSEEEDGSQTVLTIPMIQDSRAELWRKTLKAFTHLYERYLDQYAWFMKADDDTYVLVDQLNNFLSQQSSDMPIYFGYRFRKYVKQGYMSGGPGYVLSRRAVELLVESGIKTNRTECLPVDDEFEDLEMGTCLEAVGVEAGDTRDPQGFPTFLALSPLNLLSNFKIDNTSWYYDYAYYRPVEAGKKCCSKRPISFHYIDPNQMYLIDWLLYDVKRC